MVLEAKKSKVKPSKDQVSNDNLFPGLQMGVFSLYPTYTE